MPKKGQYKDALGRNRNFEEVAEELGLSNGQKRNKNQRETYTVRNAGQGQVPVRGENQNPDK